MRRISLTRNLNGAVSFDLFQFQMGEILAKLEDYLNNRVDIHYVDNDNRLQVLPTLQKGDLVFDFTKTPGVATLQQWDGTKLIPLDINTLLGTPGREIELRKTATYIQWRYFGDPAWTNLVALSDITGPAGAPGPAGADGRQVELQANSTHIQWRYVGDPGWTNLVALSAITGPAGTPGAPGAPGSAGTPGSVWRHGTGAPAGGLGINGDYYLNDPTGDIYFKAGGSYSIVANIKGARWFSYPGVPTIPVTFTEVNGDFAINASNGDYYRLDTSGPTWFLLGNLRGPVGPGALHGVGNPGSGLGVDNQIYVNETQGDLWFKWAGVWTLYGANAYYFQGKAFNSTSPSNGDVIVFDSSLLGGTGAWKAAAPTGGGTFAGMDDETRARLNLAIL